MATCIIIIKSTVVAVLWWYASQEKFVATTVTQQPYILSQRGGSILMFQLTCWRDAMHAVARVADDPLGQHNYYRYLFACTRRVLFKRNRKFILADHCMIITPTCTCTN